MGKKMTKAQARKRLNEASVKIAAVNMAAFDGKLGGVNFTDMKKLFPMIIELRKIAERMK